MLTLLLSTLVSFSEPAHAVGFSSGNQFESQRISGQVSVYCANGQISNYRCQMEILNPGELDYFVGPQGVNADKVELKATRENGSIKTKSGKYDAAKGRSKDRFNLWILTLTQKPLLDLGVNKVEYNMTKSGNSVTTGEFSVDVKRVEPATCPYRSYTSYDPQGCDGASICDRYFQDENYCQ